MSNFRNLLNRLKNSAVAWSWLFNGLRLGAGLLLLPLLAIKLSKPDLGMYILFWNLAALVPIIDFGFSVTIGRNVSHAMGGATDLRAHGLAPSAGAPNFPLLWQLLQATRRLYRHLVLGAIFILGTFGTAMVWLRVNETDFPTVSWSAWAVTLIAAVWEFYAGWWNVFLRGTNQVVRAAKISVLSYGLQLGLACGLLLGNAGLLSVPVAVLVSNVLQRYLARRACLDLLRDKPTGTEKLSVTNLVTALWPSSWRTGVQFFSTYASSAASIFLCTALFGLEASAKFGLSVRIIAIIQGMASVWTIVKWPLIGQLRAAHDFPTLRRIFRPRVWLQMTTFAALALLAIPLAPFLLGWIGSDKEVLPIFWLSLLALNALLESHYSLWGTLIFMENRMPYFWPVVISNMASVGLSLLLIFKAEFGLGAFVLAPLATGLLFNYWKWPREGAKSLKTTWLRFMFFSKC